MMSTETGTGNGDLFMNARAVEQARRAAMMRTGKNRVAGKGHPTTSNTEYTREELEFHAAIEVWKNQTGRRFPTWSEVLRVVQALGYAKG